MFLLGSVLRCLLRDDVLMWWDETSMWFRDVGNACRVICQYGVVTKVKTRPLRGFCFNEQSVDPQQTSLSVKVESNSQKRDECCCFQTRCVWPSLVVYDVLASFWGLVTVMWVMCRVWVLPQNALLWVNFSINSSNTRVFRTASLSGGFQCKLQVPPWLSCTVLSNVSNSAEFR